MNNYGNERRLRGRTRLPREIYFRTQSMLEFGKGNLYDLSRAGALFTTEHDLAIDTLIHFVLHADDPQTSGLEVMAVIIRKTIYVTRRRKFEYGCQFEYRQSRERRTLNVEVRYRTSGMSTFENGLLWNISTGGALFSAQRELDLDMSVHLICFLNDPQKPPLQTIANIVRKEFYPTRRRRFGYGCHFDQPVGFG